MRKLVPRSLDQTLRRVLHRLGLSHRLDLMGILLLVAGDEAEADTGATMTAGSSTTASSRTDSLTVVSSIIASLRTEGHQIHQLLDESSTTQIIHQKRNRRPRDAVTIRHLQRGTRRLKMISKYQFEHQEDRTEAEEVVLVLLGEELRRVDYLPSTSHFSSQLHHLFSVSCCVLPNIANHLTIARECQSI